MRNSIEQQPVETRLMITSIGLITAVISLHLFNIRIEVLGFFFFASLWKISSLRYPRLIDNKLILTLVSMIGLLLSFTLYGPPIGRDPGVAFLITLLGLKLVESKTRRDLRIIIFLGYFVTITHFLYQGSLMIVLFLLSLVIGLTWLMIQIGHIDPDRQKRQDIKFALRLFIQSIPFAIVLFFLFPRLAGSLWLLQSSSGQGITGMSEQLNMGTISNLIPSQEIAFIAAFENDKVPPKHQRYWRGGVLWDTDGRTWSRGEPLNQSISDFKAISDRYDYEITLSPTEQNWLFALDIPALVPPDSMVDSDYHLYRKTKIRETFRYTMSSYGSYLNSHLPGQQSDKGRAINDKVITPRLEALVETLKASSSVDGVVGHSDFINRVLNYFHQNNFIYSLRPPILSSNYPVDEFLFETQKGFCEHYASSFATIMRFADIPSRIVVGYLGGELNPRTNEITVRQSEAHAWVEVWTENNGWMRVDPTAAIAPERIENPIDYAQSLNANGLVKYNHLSLDFISKFTREMRWFSALVRQKWQRWFVNFNYQRQQKLFGFLGLQEFGLQAIAAFAFLLGLLLVSLITFLFFRRENHKLDPVQKSYLLFCKKCTQAGLTRGHNEGPIQFSQRCIAHFPTQKTSLLKIINAYIALRYEEEGSLAKPQTFAIAVKQLNLNNAR